VGFSLGGMIAQQLAFEYPDIIRRMILFGTGPAGGEGMTFTELSVDDLGDPEALLMFAFFTSSEANKAAGRAYIERLKLRVADRDAPICKKAAGAQLEAIREWGTIPSTDRYAMLARIHQQTLIVHGSQDIVVIPVNAFLLAQHLSDAQLVMHPDASHGAQSQHAEIFLEHARLFLNGRAGVCPMDRVGGSSVREWGVLRDMRRYKWRGQAQRPDRSSRRRKRYQSR
jgi:pimeloyl-ACP methyl ester carboxylesterase